MRRDPLGCISEAMVKLGWTASGPDSWATTLTNGQVFPVWASVEQDWLRVEAELVEFSGVTPWDVLVAGSSMPPSIGTALRFFAPHVTSIRLVADLDPDDRETWRSRIARLSRDLIAAASRIDAPKPDGTETNAPLPESLAETVRESGWSLESRGEHELAIALDDGDGIGASARLSARGDGHRLFAPLRTWTIAEDDESADASALFLLLAAHRVRAVRAVARREAGKPATSVGWETTLPVEPRSEDVDRALQSLSVACRHSAREVRALASPALHRQFMKQRTAGLHEPAPSPVAHSSR